MAVVPLSPDPSEGVMPILNGAEREVIRRFAAGDRESRAAAVKVYDAACKSMMGDSRKWEYEHRDSPHMTFMREATSKCPDLMLRYNARLKLVGADNLPPATWPNEPE